MRRVVVTGLGAVTPLGVGVRQTWTRLLNGETGIVSVASREPQSHWKELTSTVAGLVPAGGAVGQWRAADWISKSDQRRMSLFAQYAVAASHMALEDAGLQDLGPEDLEMTGVCLGSGIGNLDEIYDTSLAHSAHVRSSLHHRSHALLRLQQATESVANGISRVTKRSHPYSSPRY